MQFSSHIRFGLRAIVTCLMAFGAVAAQAQTSAGGDDTLINMAQAWRKKDTNTLSMLLPQAAGHPLEPWAAYWELSARLDTASAAEVDAFLQRYAGTYQEDRLRNDWLLRLGKNRDFQGFARYYPAFRMRDDREVLCYALYAEATLGGRGGRDAARELRDAWYAQRDSDDGCTLAAGALRQKGVIRDDDVWRKARLAAETNRMGAARTAVGVVDGAAALSVPGVFSNPASYLASQADTGSRSARELAVLALLRMAAGNPMSAAQAMQTGWASRLEARDRNWVWGEIGRQAALNLDSAAMNYFSQVRNLHDLDDGKLGWMARAALRMGYWPQVRHAIEAMSPEAQREPVWVYWRARALQGGLHVGHAADREAASLYRGIAGHRGFYEQLALEALGERIGTPAAPPGLSGSERAAARANPGLQRALYAMNIGLRSEGTREWNYTTNLHQSGGMNDRELLAAAALACERQWWDRCINTSERTKAVFDLQQRFPTPYRNVVVPRSEATGVDPAYVYGLIRQESRFASAARSGVGASGLMQVMPATARYTARKLGIPYEPSMLADLDTNVRLGTGYLKLVQDDFGGSLPMAAAAYNAGPNRPRAWRNGPMLEGAIWAENIPFGETRDYVKKVLSNTVNYAILLTGQPQSLRSRLGQVGPLAPGLPDMARDLPSSAVRQIMPSGEVRVLTDPTDAP